MQDVFSLSDGEQISITWPSRISQEDFGDVWDWLEIVKRKIGRASDLSSKEAQCPAST